LRSNRLRNSPGCQPKAGAPASTHPTKSARRGRRDKFKLSRLRNAQLAASHRTPRARGCICWNSLRMSRSCFRASAEMRGRPTEIRRSNKSPRLTTSVIPFKIAGRLVRKSPLRHQSKGHEWQSQPPWKAGTEHPKTNRASVKCCRSRGSRNYAPLWQGPVHPRRVRLTASWGSTHERSMRVIVDFPVPCGPPGSSEDTGRGMKRR